MTVVVVTDQMDVTADLVVRELTRGGVDVFRFDTAQFPAELELAARFTGAAWEGMLKLGSRRVRLADVTSVYYRKPSPFRLSEDMTELEAAFAAREAKFGLGGVLASLTCGWINHPFRLARASYKPVWMVEAAFAGLAQPATLVTNRPETASAFVSRSPDGAVYKSMSGGPGRAHTALYTTKVTADEAAGDATSATAHLLQEHVVKDHEARVTVVDRNVFAARIDAHSPAARLDWRADYDALAYRVVEPPAPVMSGITRLMRRLGLRFTALDFIIDASGRWLLVDVNAGGQWAWIAQRTGLPIAEAVATALTTAPEEETPCL